MYKIELELLAIFVKRKCMYLQICKIFESPNHKKDCVRKSQILKVSHLRKVRKSNKLFKSANFRIAICGTYLRTAHL